MIETKRNQDGRRLWVGFGQALFASVALGATVGLALWLGCYHQSDMTKTWGQFLAFTIGLAGIVSGLAALTKLKPKFKTKPKQWPVLVSVAVLSLAIGAWSAQLVYDRQVETSGATKCAGYDVAASSLTWS